MYLVEDGHLRPPPHPRASVAHFLQSKVSTPHGSCAHMQWAVKPRVCQSLPEMHVRCKAADLRDFLVSFTYTLLAKILTCQVSGANARVREAEGQQAEIGRALVKTNKVAVASSVEAEQSQARCNAGEGETAQPRDPVAVLEQAEGGD